ncbi:MAG: undecaprenyl-diphosphatase UppP [Chloroflexi bacterium]|nr:undecaprenyl-diphosphatase UppP [Chloroflexota bacterium]
MDPILAALVLGIAQGLTEFLPISSSGHLILVPALLGWRDPFISSLPFAVMLHVGTLLALLVYFRADWLRLVPAGLASLRDRSTAGDPDRRLAMLLAVTIAPAALAGLLFNDFIEREVRAVGLVALMLVVGAGLLWLAERWGRRDRSIGDLTVVDAFTIGVAQAGALIPGISRSGISIAAGLFLGLDRAAAARFSFLMAAPIIAGAGLFEARRLLSGDVALDGNLPTLVVGMAGAFASGLLAIHGLLRFLRANSTLPFVVYRVLLAAAVFVWLLR